MVFSGGCKQRSNSLGFFQMSLVDKLNVFAVDRVKISVRDLVQGASYRIMSASRHANKFGSYSVLLNLQDQKYLFLPNRIASRIDESELDQFNRGNMAIIYQGDSETKYFNKPIELVQFISLDS